jgi:hypothetical protein
VDEPGELATSASRDASAASDHAGAGAKPHLGRKWSKASAMALALMHKAPRQDNNSGHYSTISISAIVRHSEAGFIFFV